MLQLPLNVQLDDSAKFDNFYADNNRQLVTRLNQIQGQSDAFIYVWGATDTGKTHLAQALCHQANLAQLSTAYLPLENPQLAPLMLEGMGTMDVICIDNLENVVSKPDWELGLFNLYNQLKAEHKSLADFSHAAPFSLPIQLADLQSRLSAMEIYKLEGLQDHQKVELFKQRAANRGLDISEEVIRYIFSRHSRSLADLMTILERLDHFSIALKRKISIPLVKEILAKKEAD